jgi:hypothetical protein
MVAFRRPGETAASAFGIAFSADRSTDLETSAAAARHHQQQHKTAAQRQHQAAGDVGFPRHQKTVLHAIESHATVVLSTDDAAGA